MEAMTSCDERREAAGRMREEAAEFRRLGEEYDHVWTVDLGDAPAEFQDVAHFAGLDGVVREDELFDRMADLIDPTCHVVTSGEWRGKPIGSACSVCHAPLYPSTAWTGGMRYCSQCGHRVVDDD